MKHLPCLLCNELRRLYFAPSTYSAGFLFLLLFAAFYFNVLLKFSSEAQTVLPSEVFFQTFWIPVWTAVPLLTMSSIAEERSLGTLELLMITPATVTEVLLSKFFAAYLWYCLLWLLGLSFPLIAVWLLNDTVATTRLLDLPTLVGGYVFVGLSGLLFVAIGIFASCLTQTQLVAAMLSFSLLFILTVGAYVMQQQWLNLPEWLEGIGEYLSLFKHLDGFGRGIFDSRPFFFYLTGTVLILWLSTLIVGRKLDR